MVTTIEAMKQVVMNAGGRLGETQYLHNLADLIGDYREVSIDSLKVNAFNKNRMEKAGVTRVTIGNNREVWTTSRANVILNGGGLVGTERSEGVTRSDIETVVATPTPITVSEGGVFYGIPRAESTDDAYLTSLIPKVVGFVESDRQEFRLMANRYKRSLAGDTIKSHMLAEGPTGCGKSLLAKDFFANLNTPLLRVNLSDGITEDAFIGTRTIVDGNVVFQDGILTMAADKGLPILVDEINAGRENILIALNGLMDTGILVIPEDNNRVVTAKAGFMVIGTMNPPEDYAGVNAMNQATKNRFTYNLPFSYLPTEKEIEVVMAQTGFKDEEVVRSLVNLANDLRRLKSEGQLESDTSTRTLVQLVDELGDLSISEAVQYVMLGRYNSDERGHVEAAARARLADY